MMPWDLPPDFPTVEDRTEKFLQESQDLFRSCHPDLEPPPPSPELLEICKELAEDEYAMELEIWEQEHAGEDWKR